MADADYYSLVPFKSEGFFWVTFTGGISMGRLARAYESFRSHPDYVPGTDELVDFTQSSLAEMSQKEIDTIRDYMIATPEQHGCKSVIVVNSAVEYGLSRMMGMNLDFDVPTERFVCYSVREALEWLRPGQADELLARHKAALADGATL